MVSGELVKPATLGARTAIGSIWAASARLFARFSDLITLIVLARFLVPADFGLVTIAASLVAVLEAITNLPVSTPLVRLEKVEKAHLDAAFTVSLLRGLLIILVVGAAAYPISAIYGDPRLVPIMLVLSLAPMARGLQSPAMAFLFKNMQFRQTFLIEGLSKLAGLLAAVTIAVMIQSYWAIVAGTVGSAIVATLLSFVFAPYRIGLSLTQWRFLWEFLRWNSLSQLVSAMSWQFDRLFMGRYIPSAQLGLYGMAIAFPAMIEQSLSRSISNPLISSFVHVKDDLPRLKRVFRQSDAAIITVGLPAFVGLFLFAGPFVTLMFDPQWSPMVPILQGLSIAFVPVVVRIPFRPLAMAMGRTDLVFRATFAASILRVGFVVGGFFVAGLPGVIWAIGLAGVFNGLIYMHHIRKLIDLSFGQQLHSLWRPVLATLAMVAQAYMLLPWLSEMSGWSLGLGLVFSILVCATVYAIAILIIWRVAGRPGGLEQMVVSRMRSVFARVAR